MLDIFILFEGFDQFQNILGVLAFDGHDGIRIRDHRYFGGSRFDLLGCQGILNSFQLCRVTIDIKRIALGFNIFCSGIQCRLYDRIFAGFGLINGQIPLLGK